MKKATDTGAPTEEEKANQFDEMVKAMIDKMSRNVSPDLNKNQIQASIYTRLENWAKKQGIDWDSQLPRFIKHIGACAEARHQRVQKFMADQAAKRQNVLRDGIE